MGGRCQYGIEFPGNVSRKGLYVSKNDTINIINYNNAQQFATSAAYPQGRGQVAGKKLLK